MSDRALLEGIALDPQAGVESAIASYGTSLLGRLTKKAQRLGLAPEDAEEIFQDALLRLIQPTVRAEILARGGEILPYLTRWGYWRLSDLRRKAQGKVAEEHARTDPTDSTTLDPSEAALAVERLLHELSPRDELVLRLRYHDHLTNEEVAVQLAISPGAAKKAAHDARRRLKDLLIECGINFKEGSP